MKQAVRIMVSVAILLATPKTAAGISVSTILPIPEITKPGAVAVDVPTRRNQLSLLAATHLCPNSLPFGDALLFDSVLAPSGYGLDDRFNAVSARFRTLGAACLGGVKEACNSIYDYALDWAQNSGLGRPKGGKYDGLFWNGTLTANMRLLSPMLAALGVAEQVSPLPTQDRDVLGIYILHTP